MKSLLIAFFIFAGFPAGSVFATGTGSDSDAPFTIMEANAVSVTVSVGREGDTDSERTFAITNVTKVTIDNLPSSGADLKGGMVAEISTTQDGHTATYINAHDPRGIK
jgi:hypothetical protein